MNTHIFKNNFKIINVTECREISVIELNFKVSYENKKNVLPFMAHWRFISPVLVVLVVLETLCGERWLANPAMQSDEPTDCVAGV